MGVGRGQQLLGLVLGKTRRPSVRWLVTLSWAHGILFNFNKHMALMCWYFWQEHILANRNLLKKKINSHFALCSICSPTQGTGSKVTWHLSIFSGTSLCGYPDRECHSPSLLSATEVSILPTSIFTIPMKTNHYYIAWMFGIDFDFPDSQ